MCAIGLSCFKCKRCFKTSSENFRFFFTAIHKSLKEVANRLNGFSLNFKYSFQLFSPWEKTLLGGGGHFRTSRTSLKNDSVLFLFSKVSRELFRYLKRGLPYRTNYNALNPQRPRQFLSPQPYQNRQFLK